MKYKILQSTNLFSLEGRVNSHIKTGWVVSGSLVIDLYRPVRMYCQAMVRA